MFIRSFCWRGYSLVSVVLRREYSERMPGMFGGSRASFANFKLRATMVTAILPSMTGSSHEHESSTGHIGSEQGGARHSVSPSLDSEVTITPANFNGRPRQSAVNGNGTIKKGKTSISSSPPRLAGLVGVFTGCGALVALAVFLPLPAQFSHLKGITQGQAVADSFYVVGVVALFVACFCFFGLRGLQGEEGKGWRLLLGRSPHKYQGVPSEEGIEAVTKRVPFLPYWRLLLDSTVLGFKDAQIGLGYLGGFVARASSVGISLFIPLYINAYFIRNGFCQGSPNDPSPELKKECRAAYVLSAELTGVSQLVALLCAPAFGYLSDRYRRFNFPLLVASIFGIIGYTAFARLVSPEPKNIDGRGGSPAVFLIVSMIGISQIGAIVCSLGLLGRGVLGDEGGYNLSSQLRGSQTPPNAFVTDTTETAPLIGSSSTPAQTKSRSHLKGSIAGVYSLSGGAAILLLTKLGGTLFDTLSTGAPFYMMAIFNAMLLVIGIGAGVYREIRTRKTAD